MDFEEGDYLINVDRLKAKFFDEFMELSHNGSVNCQVEDLLMEQCKIIDAIEQYGQKMG